MRGRVAGRDSARASARDRANRGSGSIDKTGDRPGQATRGTYLGGLLGRPPCPEPDCLHLPLVQVIYGEIDVHLLRYSRVRPRRWPVVRHTKGGQPTSVRSDRDVLVTRQGDFATHEFGPELSQGRRIITIKRYRCQAGHDHVRHVTSVPTRQQRSSVVLAVMMLGQQGVGSDGSIRRPLLGTTVRRSLMRRSQSVVPGRRRAVHPTSVERRPPARACPCAGPNPDTDPR
jgi:hypothetical protein